MPEPEQGGEREDPSTPRSGEPAPRLVLLTGRPGVGKTTAVRRLAERLGPDSHSVDGPGEGGLDAAPPPLRVAGFLTEEIREDGERKGFRAVALPGEGERTIAHRELETGPRVGAYGVDVDAVDGLAEEALDPGRTPDVWLIDEIGKMECFSARFVDAVRTLLEGDRPVVATVGAGGTNFMEEVRRREDAELWRVTRENRNALPSRLDRRMRKLVGEPGS